MPQANPPRTVVRLRIELQATMGWSDSHLHAFRFGATTYGMLDDDEDEVMRR
jgi:hypothetical protein